jgi:hypothetical protein
MFAKVMGFDPNEIFTKDALARPHRTVVSSEDRKIKVLNEALKNAILEELRNALPVYATPE